MKAANPSSGPCPVQRYRVALARIASEFGASFAAVFLRDDRDAKLLRPACTRNWPQSAARFLSDTRIRVGRGPTGRSVQAGQGVAISDVAAAGHEDWLLPARELGFVAVMAEPLGGDGAIGALSLYFRERRCFSPGERARLRALALELSGPVAE